MLEGLHEHFLAAAGAEGPAVGKSLYEVGVGKTLGVEVLVAVAN
jgi:hypothetical protein